MPRRVVAPARHDRPAPEGSGAGRSAGRWQPDQALVVRRVVVLLAGVAFAGAVALVAAVALVGAGAAADVPAAVLGFASVTGSPSSSDLTGVTTRSFTVSTTVPAACSAAPSTLATWSFFFRSV